MNNRKKKTGKTCIAGITTCAMLFSMLPADLAAAAPAGKAELKKKLTVQVGQTKTLKVKNVKKTVKWKILSGKKNISLKKKGKKALSVSVKGKKAGQAKIQAVVNTGKTRKLTCRISVKAARKNTKKPSTGVPGSSPAAAQAVPTPGSQVQPVQTQAPVQQTMLPGNSPFPPEHSMLPPSGEETPDPAGSALPPYGEMSPDPSASATEMPPSPSASVEETTPSPSAPAVEMSPSPSASAVETSPSPSAAATETPLPPPGSHSQDVEALKKLIEQQKNLGASVNEDIESDKYGWEEIGGESRLISIDWDECHLAGSISLAELPALRIFYGDEGDMTELDVSQNQALREISFHSATQIASIDLSKNSLLEYVGVTETQLKELDLQNMLYLSRIEFDIKKLEKLNISGSGKAAESISINLIEGTGARPGALQELIAKDCGEIVVKLNILKNLKKLDLRSSSINRVHVSEKLEDLWTDEHTDISSLDLPLHEGLHWNGTAVTEIGKLDLSAFTSLSSLTLSVSIPPDSPDPSQNQALEETSMSNISLGSLDLSQNQVLERLSLSDVSISSLDLSRNEGLLSLELSNMPLSSLDLSGNEALELLSISDIPLGSLDLKHNMSLYTLTLRNTKVDSLDLSRNMALRTVDCNSNLITELNVSRCIFLRRLRCGGNGLTSLDASGCAALQSLNCIVNELTSLNVSGCAALQSLACGGNQALASLDVSTLSNLRRISCDQDLQIIGMTDGVEVDRNIPDNTNTETDDTNTEQEE